jgi:hypothetical protein
MLFLCFIPHCRLFFARVSLLCYHEINYQVYYCLSFALLPIYISRGISKLLTVIEAIRDIAINPVCRRVRISPQ